MLLSFEKKQERGGEFFLVMKFENSTKEVLFSDIESLELSEDGNKISLEYFVEKEKQIWDVL